MTRVALRVAVLACLAVVLVPTRALAQGHLQLIGGMTNAAERQPFFGAGIGLRVAFVEAGVEAGYFKDILPKGIASALNDLQRERGLPVQGIASMPGVYALGSMRVIPSAGPIRPFIAVGAGVARLRPRIDVEVGGLSLGDVFGLTSFGERSEPLGMFGAGLRVDGGAFHVEGGYRFLTISSDFRPLGLNGGRVRTRVNNVYAALGARF